MPDWVPARDLPTGTITFVLTDVEGSTRIWETDSGAMGQAMALHDSLIEEQVARNSGSLVRPRGEGDSRFAVFARAYDAVAAARDLQGAFAGRAWPTATPLRIRIALHTGEADLRAGDYYGSDVNRCAQLRALAHGGQTLLSQATFELVYDATPADVSLLDLGEHRLKDLQRPEHVYQLDVAGVPSDFPPLQSVDSFRNNLPVQLTSFVGREGELAEVKELLGTTHLLTLTGPGGTGKTRLSLQLAAESMRDFGDGTWLVELAPVSDPALIAQTVATTLGVRESPGRTILEALTDYLRAKSLLLILDNCEHVIGTCAKLAEGLLRAAPKLKILASSREPLGIAGETAYRVPSLPLPPDGRDFRTPQDLRSLNENDCVRLFLDRAAAVNSDFCLTAKNAFAIAEICRRLDGIPLAIELAAARTRVLSPGEIAARMDDRFRLLTGGSRTALERHQTLRALIDWSYDLLPEPECVLLRRLSVFAGGWTLEAAQVVCAEGLGQEALDLLTHLVDKSLVAVEAQAEEARFRLPETIRQYARDKLYESGEAYGLRDQHLEFFLHLAEQAEPNLRTAAQLAWLQRLDVEHDNLRTALAWALESGHSDHALRLAGALGYFWMLRGYFSEGQRWLEEALALSERDQSRRVEAGGYIPSRTEKAQRAKALYTAAMPYMAAMNAKRARTVIEESLGLWRELGDKWWTAVALPFAGLIIVMDGEVQTAIARDEEAVSLARELEDPWPLAGALIRLGDDLKAQGTDVAAARQALEEGVAVARKVGDKMLLSEGLRELGSLNHGEGDLAAAESLIEEALAAARSIGGTFSVLLALCELVGVACLQNDPAKAESYCLELWAMVRETGSPFAAVFALMAFGWAASFGGEPGKGARLFAATDKLLSQRGVNINVPGIEASPFVKVYKQALAKAQAQLGPEAFQAAWAEGQQMTAEQALALATEDASEEQS